MFPTTTLVPATPAIDEDSIAEWLQAKAATYGIKGLVLKIANDGIGYRCVASIEVDRSLTHGFGATMDEAVAELRTKIKTPAQLLAEKQAKFIELQREIEALEKEAA